MTPRLTAPEAAEHLGISPRQLYNLNAADNDFPEPQYTGRTPTWDPADLDARRTRHPARKRSDLRRSAPPAQESDSPPG